MTTPCIRRIGPILSRAEPAVRRAQKLLAFDLAQKFGGKPLSLSRPAA
jgi:hypothetical protein